MEIDNYSMFGSPKQRKDVNRHAQPGNYRPIPRDTRTEPKLSPEFIIRQEYKDLAELRIVKYLTGLGAWVFRTDYPFDLEADFKEQDYLINFHSYNVFSRDRKYRPYITVSDHILTQLVGYNTPYTKLMMFEVEENPHHQYNRLYNICERDYLYIPIDTIAAVGTPSLSSHSIKISKIHLRPFRRIFDPYWGVMK